MSNARVRGELLSADDSVVPSSSPVAGPSSKTDIKEGSKKVLTAAQRRLKERTRRLVARKSSTSTPRKRKSGGRTKATNKTPSSSTRDRPIQKGKSYRTRASREPKEKDPECEEVRIKKYVRDTKNGGRSRNDWKARKSVRLGSERNKRPDRPFNFEDADEREEVLKRLRYGFD